MKQEEMQEAVRSCHFFPGGVMCQNIGVSALGEVCAIQRGPELYEARVGVAIMGGGGEELKATPFDEDYPDNFCSGTGATVEEAVANLKKDMSKLADSLWDE